MAAARVVIDTNVWISAALMPGGVPAQVVRRVLALGLPVFSQTTFDELRSRLWKPKFDRWVTLEQRQALLHDLSACALWVEIPAEMQTRRFSRDLDDDAFIHAALVAEANWVISGDHDLLSITEPLPLAILSPAQAMADTAFASALR